MPFLHSVRHFYGKGKWKVENNETLKVRHIPPNYGGGINILGMHFEIVFLVEGILLGLFLFFLLFVPMVRWNLCEIPRAIGISGAFCGVGFVLGVKGINDEPVTTFLAGVLHFLKRRRRAYYNPRVKMEAKPPRLKKSLEDKDLLPREKLVLLFEKYQKKWQGYKSRKIQEAEERDSFHSDRLYFEDDEGVIKKPPEYQSLREERNLLKKKRKIERFEKEKGMEP